jgi:DNA helicase II / ATP-dependent DNA helicase PcrA
MSPHEPLCVLAGAGAGKTTVLTRRVARRILDGSGSAEHVLVVTFTRKAACELAGRLGVLGVSERVRAGTFHATAFEQLRRNWADSGVAAPRLLDDPSRLISELLTSRRSDGASPRFAGASPATISALATEMHWARSRLIVPEDYPRAATATSRTLVGPANEIGDIYSSYCKEKRRRGIVDLDDLLELCASVLENDDEAARVQRWRVRHLFVDEFQDMNPLQWRLLRAWLGDRRDLFVVGDPRQAVYGWNGADPTLFDRLPDLLPGTEVISLDDNHRSTPQIVATASAVLGSSPAPIGCKTSNTRSKGRSNARSTRPDGPTPQVAGFDCDQYEALAVARWLRRAHRPGRSWSQLAVLARTNSRLDPLKKVLGQCGIPFRASTGDRLDPATEKVLGVLGSVPTTMSLRAALGEMVVSSPDSELEPEGEDTPDIAASALPTDLWRLAEDHAVEEPDATVGSFLAWVAANNDEGAVSSTRAPCVEVATFHKAKGLEWPAVAVIGLEDGLVPIVYASTPEALAEEQRLLYVALTRAEEELWCSWAARRSGNTTSGPSEPSRFLGPITGVAREMDEPQGVEARLARVAELRSKLLNAV